MKWEYLVTYLGYGEERDLAGLGKLGWELVTVLEPKDEGIKAYFKRPLRAKSEDEIMKHFDTGEIDTIKDYKRSSLV